MTKGVASTAPRRSYGCVPVCVCAGLHEHINKLEQMIAENQQSDKIICIKFLFTVENFIGSWPLYSFFFFCIWIAVLGFYFVTAVSKSLVHTYTRRSCSDQSTVLCMAHCIISDGVYQFLMSIFMRVFRQTKNAKTTSTPFSGIYALK